MHESSEELHLATPVVFVRVGRLKYYDRRFDGDVLPIGGGAWNLEQPGSEVENFRPVRGSLHGYAEVGSNGYQRRRVGVRPDEDGWMHGVLLIFIAPLHDGQRIVGWYNNASLLTRTQERPFGLYGLSNIRASAKDAVLLPLSGRTCPVPRGKGGFGQKNVLYALDPVGRRRNAPWLTDALRFVRSYTGPNLLSNDERGAVSDLGLGAGFRQSAAERRAIESASMRLAQRYFEERGYVVQDVSKKHPYDLLCSHRQKESFNVEVKGTTSYGHQVVLTRNEVASARKHPTALFVASELTLVRRRNRLHVSTRTCRVKCTMNWRPARADLMPMQYLYRVP